MTRFDPTQVGWRLGRSHAPRGGQLWVPFDRTTGVYGPQGSGKTLDLLTPALLAAPGAALVTMTKLDDLLLTLDRRSRGGRPVAVLDPFGMAPGVPELVWDPVSGCVDSMVAERRAKAFTAGTVKGAVAGGTGDDAARFYAAEGAKVLQAFFHAAALTGRTLDHVLEWVANPANATAPEEILRTHPHAAQFWHGLLRGALHGDDRTAGNTATTVQQAMSLFFQEPIRRRCVPGPGRPATDITDLITAGGTIYLLGRDDPYASASPLMTALAEHVLDTALGLANQSPWGRLCPSFLACLDELPSTTPLPTLRTRMANERALGISFIYAAQTWRQLVICYGEDEARTLFGLTNNVVVFGGGKDGHFYREISDLVGTTRVTRTSYNTGRGGSGRTTAGEDTPILRPEEIRQLPEGKALVIAENARPLIAKLHRCIDGKAGKRLLADQGAARDRVGHARGQTISPAARTTAAVAVAQQMDLHATAAPGSHNSRVWSLMVSITSEFPHRGRWSATPTPSWTWPGPAPTTRNEPWEALGAASPMGPAQLPADVAHPGVGVARPGGGLDQPRIHLATRPVHPLMLARAPAHRPRAGRDRRPAPNRRIRVQRRRPRGMAPVRPTGVPGPCRLPHGDLLRPSQTRRLAGRRPPPRVPIRAGHPEPQRAVQQ